MVGGFLQKMGVDMKDVKAGENPWAFAGGEGRCHWKGGEHKLKRATLITKPEDLLEG
jgi:hypothetical protein